MLTMKNDQDCNPSMDTLEDDLIAVAQKLEETEKGKNLNEKSRKESKNSITGLFKASENNDDAQSKQRRKKNSGSQLKRGVSDSESSRIQPYEATRTVNAKEIQRRKRNRTSVQKLKEIIPCIEDDAGEIETCEMAAKYIFFMKTQVGPQFDKDFLMQQIL